MRMEVENGNHMECESEWCGAVRVAEGTGTIADKRQAEQRQDTEEKTDTMHTSNPIPFATRSHSPHPILHLSAVCPASPPGESR